MSTTIHVDIVSAEGQIFSGDAEMVIVPARMGELGITPRHAPLLTLLKPGEVRVRIPDDPDEHFFYVTGGILEIQPRRVTILSDSCLRADQLDEATALEARRQAQEALSGATEKTDLARAQAQLIEASARYQAAQKLKRVRR